MYEFVITGHFIGGAKHFDVGGVRSKGTEVELGREFAFATNTLFRSCEALLAREARVLELGCGTGSTALRLADDVASYTATESRKR